MSIFKNKLKINQNKKKNSKGKMLKEKITFKIIKQNFITA